VRRAAPSLAFVSALGVAASLVHCGAFDTAETTNAPDASPSEGGVSDANLPIGDGGADAPSNGDGGPSACVDPVAPTHPCFEGSGSCDGDLVAVNSLSGPAPDGGTLTLGYPHGLALDGGATYFAALVDAALARDGAGLGFVFRWDGTKVERLTAALDSPGFLAARDGYLYYRNRKNATDWVVERLKLPVAACEGSACPAPEIVALVSGAPISRVHPVTPSLLLFRVGDTRLFRSVPPVGGAQWATTDISPGTPMPPSTLSTGPRAFWGVDSALWKVDASASAYFVGGVAPGAPKAKLVTSTCDAVYVYDDALTTKPLHSATSGGYKEVDCGGAVCAVTLSFDLAADAKFVYVARPNNQGLQAIPRGGGPPVRINSGADAWDVAVDDDYVLLTDLNGKAVRRIRKRPK